MSGGAVAALMVLVAMSITTTPAHGTETAITVARDHVTIALAFGAMPDGAAPIATPDALRRARLPLDALAEPGHPAGVPVELRAQLAAASIDVALLDLPEDPPEPARVTRTLTRVSATDAGTDGQGHGHGHGQGEPAGPSRTLVLAAAEPAPAERTLRVVEPPPSDEPGDDASEVWEIPVREPRVTSRFGPRIDPITGAAGRMHRGTDYGAPTGTPVYATASGTVLLGGWCDRGTGNCVVIEHDDGWRSQYFHLSAVHTSSGARVRQGEHIGDIGSTGRSTGPHLHFQLGQGSEAVDPESLFGLPVGSRP